MTADVALGEDFLQDVIGAMAKDIANVFVPGSSLGVVLAKHVGLAFCRAGWNWLKTKKQSQQQAVIDALTQIPAERVKDIAEKELGKTRIGRQTKKDVVSLLSAIPMTTRRAITRPDDGGVPSTLLSQLPRTQTDLLRFVPLRPPRFEPGDQVPGNDYRVDLLLGQGGFAEVWRAQHIIRTGQPPVALKFCLEPELLVSLKTEIKLLDTLPEPTRSDGFVRLLDTGYSSEPPFLVYEYVDGGDLVSWLAGFEGKPPPVRDVVRILSSTARAMAIAHEHGIAHRDLKPANLLLTRDGRVKVADLGIGAIMAGAEEQSEFAGGITDSTVLRGAHTPLYADPLSESGGTAEPQTDVYAMGVIAYQLLVGNITRRIGPAWEGELRQHKVSDDLIEIIRACTELRSKRVANAGELLQRLDEIKLDGSPKKRAKRSSKDGGASSEARPQRAKSQRRSKSATNFCTNCGQQVQQRDKFCTDCGYRI